MENASLSCATGRLQRNDEKDGDVKREQDRLFGIEDWGKIFSHCPEYDFLQENMAEKGDLLSKYHQQRQPLPEQHQQPLSNYCTLDDFQFSAVLPSIQAIKESRMLWNIQTGNEERPSPFSLTSSGVLNDYGRGLTKLMGQKSSNLSMGGRKLSTEEIMRVAASRLIEFSAQRDIHFSMLMHPFGHALSGLSEEDSQDVELAHHLLAAAEKAGDQQFDCASRLLACCEWIASNTGNPVQRVVFYFSKALQDRIERETGRITSKGLEEREADKAVLSPDRILLPFHRALPFPQVTEFAGIQAIVGNVALANKVHLIDLGIRTGVHWTVLMQALVERDECPIELLKITAVGMTACKQAVEVTGKRLESFANSMKLNFSFKAVFVSNMEDLKEELFDMEADEAVAVYSKLILKSMISRPNCLENVMRVIKKLNPSIMVVTEMEANHNSPSFVNRFTEVLFFYSAFFDCMEACMDRNSQSRMIIETTKGEAIQNIVAAEGEETVIRNVKIDVWRAFFARFGMLEIEFSESSLYQASLIVKQYACGDSCTLDKDGKCLIVGWKGTPIHSLSAWKFF